MNLKKELSFKKKAPVYPSKTDINLIKTEATKGNSLTALLLFFIFLIFLAFFTKFAVVDPLASSMNSSEEVNVARAELATLVLGNETYTELTERYAQYIVTELSEEEVSLASRNDVIDLLESKIMGFANLSSIIVDGNKVSVVCVGVDLQTVSGLVQSIEQDERVSYVTVSTAQERDGKASSATIDITMKSPDEANDGTSEGQEGSAASGASSAEGVSDGN